jgi:hypothetical protein
LPPVTEDQFVLRFIEHRAPTHGINRHTEAQELQDHFALDE